MRIEIIERGQAERCDECETETHPKVYAIITDKKRWLAYSLCENHMMKLMKLLIDWSKT